MANAIAVVADVLSLVSAGAGLFNHDSADQIYTNIRVGIGSQGPTQDGNTANNVQQDGSVPHIALWDENMNRIGQYTGDQSGHLGVGSETNFQVFHTQTSPPNSDAQATYMMLAMEETDAICIAYVSLTQPGGVNYMFFGDVGFQCRADWYYSALVVDDHGYTPRCLWIDQDHSDGLKYSGFQVHMPDMVATDERIAEYSKHNQALCASTPRFQMYPDIQPDNWASFYQPPLRYNEDLTDKDLSKIIDNIGVCPGVAPYVYRGKPHTDAAIGVTQHKNPKGRKGGKGNLLGLHDKPNHLLDPKEGKDDGKGKKSPKSRNSHPGHLVTSEHAAHSAKELCCSDTSYGPDFVSHADGFYCDMDAKKHWPLCDDKKGAKDSKDACFDATTYKMRPAAADKGKTEDEAECEAKNKADDRAGCADEVPEKEYKTFRHWNLEKKSTGGKAAKAAPGKGPTRRQRR